MRRVLIMALVACIAFPVMAQLPTDPWAKNTAQQQKKLDQVKAKSVKPLISEGKIPTMCRCPIMLGKAQHGTRPWGNGKLHRT